MKGWTVTTEASYSTTGRENYFLDSKHRNHINTERIIEVAGGRSSAILMSASAEMYRATQRLNRRGGRPPTTEAIEFALELPKGLRPTDDQWKLIVNDVVLQIAATCNVNVKEIEKTVRAVVHQQDQTIKRNQRTGRIIGSGDHCHLLVGKFTTNGKYLRNLQRKTCTNAVKAAFSGAVLKHCKFDWQDYAKREGIAISTKNNYKKRENKWLFDAKRRNEVVKNNFELLQNEVARFLSQAERWLEACSADDQRQMNRQKNRMNKEVDAMSAKKEEIISPQMQKLFDSVDRVRAEINDRSGTEIINPITKTKIGF